MVRRARSGLELLGHMMRIVAVPQMQPDEHLPKRATDLRNRSLGNALRELNPRRRERSARLAAAALPGGWRWDRKTSRNVMGKLPKLASESLREARDLPIEIAAWWFLLGRSANSPARYRSRPSFRSRSIAGRCPPCCALTMRRYSRSSL